MTLLFDFICLIDRSTVARLVVSKWRYDKYFSGEGTEDCMFGKNEDVKPKRTILVVSSQPVLLVHTAPVGKILRRQDGS